MYCWILFLLPKCSQSVLCHRHVAKVQYIGIQNSIPFFSLKTPNPLYVELHAYFLSVFFPIYIYFCFQDLCLYSHDFSMNVFSFFLVLLLLIYTRYSHHFGTMHYTAAKSLCFVTFQVSLLFFLCLLV